MPTPLASRGAILSERANAMRVVDGGVRLCNSLLFLFRPLLFCLSILLKKIKQILFASKKSICFAKYTPFIALLLVGYDFFRWWEIWRRLARRAERGTPPSIFHLSKKVSNLDGLKIQKRFRGATTT